MKSRTIGQILLWVSLAIVAGIIGKLVGLPIDWSGLADWRPWKPSESISPATSSTATVSAEQKSQSSPPSGQGTETPRGTASTGVADPAPMDPGSVRMSFPEIDNGTHPNVLRLPPNPPIIHVGSLATADSNRYLNVHLSGLGISIIQMSLRAPDGSEFTKTAEILTSQPEMEFTYSVPSGEGGVYQVIVTDLRTGLSGGASTTLPGGPESSGSTAGGQAHLSVAWVTGRACDTKGAIVSIRARQIGSDTMIVRLADAYNSALSRTIYYTPAIDSLGEGYYAVAVQAPHCTGSPLSGFVGTIDNKGRIEFSVPN